jgi:hypothetical protein
LSKTYNMMALDEETARQYEEDFAQVTGG